MTIKKRIVVWYTLWMAALAVLMLLVVVSTGSYLARRQASNDLVEEVHDVLDDVQGRGGRLRLDELDEFDDGIYIQVYQDGELVFGHEDASFPPSSTLFSRSSVSSGWLVYDMEGPDGVRVRGLVSESSTLSYMGELQLATLVVLPIMLALAALGGYFIVRRSFVPVDRFVASAGEIASSADLTKRLGSDGKDDELSRMASAFDSVLDRLEEAFEKERQFTDDASHELRTPLSVIMAECSYALRHRGDNDRLVEALEAIERQGGRMNRLVEQLLTLARGDSGRLSVSKGKFDLSQLAEAVASSMESEAEGRGLRLVTKLYSPLPVDSDSDLVTRILVNYISNALQYTEKGGWILVRTEEKDGRALLSVEDSGIGIPADSIGRIWERFYQVDSSRSGSSCGLGLSMVRSIADALGGEVGVTSTEGSGSTFSFSLPVAR